MANLKHIGTGRKLLEQFVEKNGSKLTTWNRPENTRTSQLQNPTSASPSKNIIPKQNK